MVRFARADGSKGSNKRQYEEPTPWTEMVSHLESKKKKKKNKQNVKGGGENLTVEETMGVKGTESEGSILAHAPSPAHTPIPAHAPSPAHTPIPAHAPSPTHTPARQGTTQKGQKKKKGTKVTQPEYTITPEGKKVKVFRDGAQRTWFDLPYEENDIMTRYDGMWVKNGMVAELDRLKATLQEEGHDKTQIMRKMMKAKRCAHRKLRIELIYQQKSLVTEASGESVHRKKGVSKKTPKKKKKTRRSQVSDNGSSVFPDTPDGTQGNQDTLEFDEVTQIQESMEEGRNGDAEEAKRPREEQVDWTLRTPGQENYNDGERDVEMPSPTQPDVKVKKTKKRKVGRLESGRLPTESDAKVEKEEECMMGNVGDEMPTCDDDDYSGADNSTPPTPPRTDEHEKKTDFENTGRSESSQGRKEKAETNKEENQQENNTPREQQGRDFDLNRKIPPVQSEQNFEENELMTNYEGYWVLRDSLEKLEADKNRHLEAIHAARTSPGDTTSELTQEEQLTLRRGIKNSKRYHHRQLLKHMNYTGRKVDGDRKEKRKGRLASRADDEGEKVVRFDGFWIKKDGADRLYTLRRKLQSEGLSQEEVDAVIQKERRKEERVLKNERKLVCLNCREPGHMVSACPNITQEGGEGQPSICYTCGSTEHTSSSCNLKKGSENSFSFATCYICKEAGHISRQCPDNPRGLYPKGGACRGCGSVEHLAKDCPDIQKEKGEINIRVGRLKGEELEALEGDAEEAGELDASQTPPGPKKKQKVVTF